MSRAQRNRRTYFCISFGLSCPLCEGTNLSFPSPLHTQSVIPMRSLSAKHYAALVPLAFVPILALNPWLPWLILKLIGALFVFIAVLWCTFQTLDMLNAFNIQWFAAKKEAEVSEALRKQQEKYRKSTYPQEYAAGKSIKYQHFDVFHFSKYIVNQFKLTQFKFIEIPSRFIHYHHFQPPFNLIIPSFHHQDGIHYVGVTK